MWWQATNFHLIMCMGLILLSLMFMRIQPDQLSYQSLKDITRLFWLMVKLVLVKHSQWRVLNIIKMILKEVSFQELWKKSLDTFRTQRTSTQLSWWERVTFRSTMRTSAICWRRSDPVSRLERTRREVSSLRDSPSGLSELLTKSTVSCREELS